MTELNPDQIALLLKQDKERPRTGRTGPRKDPTEERTETNYFKLYHHLGEHCQNPNCVDDERAPDDRGRTTTVEVKGIKICRFCFLAGEYGITSS